LSSRVGVGGVNTIRDYSKLSRLKISTLNMFDIFSFVGVGVGGVNRIRD